MTNPFEQRAEIVDDNPAPEYGFEGRYDGEEPLRSLLIKTYALREACRAQQHKLGELSMNLSTNVMTCSHCEESWDLNELVSDVLKVSRVA